MKRAFILVLVYSLLCPGAMAHIALRARIHDVTVSPVDSDSWEQQKNIWREQNEPEWTSQDVARWIPLDMQPTNEGNRIRDQILQRTASAMMKTPFIANSFLMKTAKRVEKTTQIEMKVQEKATQDKPQGVEHRFKMDIQAFKGEARLLYSGYMNSRVEYRSRNNCLELAIEEPLSTNSKIALTHLMDRQETKQLLQYNLSW